MSAVEEWGVPLVSENPKIFALDFDDSYTADRDLWRHFISNALTRGHTVLCVTARYDTPENREDLADMYRMKIPVYYTGHAAKIWYMKEIWGISPDIWIDDQPRVVVHGV